MVDKVYYIIDEKGNIYFTSHHLLSKYSIKIMYSYLCKKHPKIKFIKCVDSIITLIDNSNYDRDFWGVFE